MEKPKSPFFNPISNVEDSLDVIKIFTILNAVKVLDEGCQSQWSRPLWWNFVCMWFGCYCNKKPFSGSVFFFFNLDLVFPKQMHPEMMYLRQTSDI